MSLSQQGFADLREAYGKVYAPKFENILDEFSDQELNELTDDIIEEVVEEFFLECLEEGWDIESVEETLCESLETSLTMLNEVSDSYYADAVKSGKAKAAKAKRAEVIGKVKTAAKRVGSALKSGAKAAYKGASRAAGYAAGAAGRAASTAKSEFKKGYERGSKGSSSSSSDSSDSGSSDSGSTASSSTSSSSGSSSSGKTRKAVGGALRSVGRLLKRGLKKAVGGTARAVSKGADRVASRLGEELEESGLFTAEEIEAILEAEMNEGYKEIDAKKHGRMYDRYKKLRTAAMKDAAETGEASGDNRYKMGKMQGVISKSAENLRKKG